MSVLKRVTYLKGLTEGLGLGKETKEEKIIHIMIGILEDVSRELAELKGDVLALDEDVSQLAEGMEDLESTLCERSVSDPAAGPAAPAPAPSGGGYQGRPNGGHAAKPTFYTVNCPSCGNEITVDNDVLGLGTIDCPSCGEKLEFDLDDME